MFLRFLLAFLLAVSPAFAGLGGIGRDSNYNSTFVGSGGGCTAATNYLARTSGGNEGGNSANITALICGLVTDGVITGNLSGATGGCGTFLDAFYVMAQQNSTDAVLNFCGTTYNLTPTTSPTFIGAYQCYSFTSNALLDTGFNASSAVSPNFVQNSASYGVWSWAVASETNPVMGNTVATGNNGSQMFTDYNGTDYYGRINSASGLSASVAQPGSKGLFTVERTSSSNTTLYWDGVSKGNVTDTSGAPFGGHTFFIGTVFGAAGSSNQTLCEAHIGASMGSTLELAFYNRLRTYMTAVGVP